MFNDKIIEASRDFVCIRLATYEDEDEANFLRTIYVNREGELDNTVFVLLSPDTKLDLSRAGRGPQFEFHSPTRLAEEMKTIAAKYEPKQREEGTIVKLPELKDVRLGINVSSCDGLPTVVCVAKDDAQLAELKNKLSPIAFSDSLAGKFVYASTTNVNDLKSVSNYRGESGFLLIKPGDYGVDGELIKALDADVDPNRLSKAMTKYANGNRRVSKNHRSHVQEGVESGKEWETEIPVTDPGSVGAMERIKEKRDRSNSGEEESLRRSGREN